MASRIWFITVFEAVRRAHEHFARLDIIVNNAGYGQFRMIEELSEQEARDQIKTNLFGARWVTQAALPFLRTQLAIAEKGYEGRLATWRAWQPAAELAQGGG
jgi:NAD(P)-dependent dehydrogenase (short-subunit alcohol dehydrogenase family)